jgi:hypothetical protein
MTYEALRAVFAVSSALCGVFALLTALIFFRWNVAGIIRLFTGGGYRRPKNIGAEKTAVAVSASEAVTAPLGVTVPLGEPGAGRGQFFVIKDITILPGNR